MLSTNEYVVISATGCIKFAQGDQNPPRSPDGCLCPYPPGDPNCLDLPAVDSSLVPFLGKRYALVGKAGTAGPPIAIGDHWAGRVASAGELYLSSNDDISGLGFGDNSQSWTVTISTCDCPFQGDINADGVIDVFDVVGVIEIAFSGVPDPQDAACPTTRGDANNDGQTDVFDVIYLIATAFSGGPHPPDPCAL